MKQCCMTVVYTGFLLFVSCRPGTGSHPLKLPDIIPERSSADVNNDSLYFSDVRIVRYCQHNDCLYVPDAGEHVIMRFGADLKLAGRFGRFGQGPGEFNGPVSLDIMKDGRVFVWDRGNRRIQIFDEHMSHEYSFPVNLPPFADINVNSRGLLYLPAADSRSENILHIYDLSGTKVDECIERKINPAGKQHNGLYVNRCDVAIDSQDCIYCSYWYTPVIEKYSPQHTLLFRVHLSELDEVKQYTAVCQTLDIDVKRSIIKKYVRFFNVDSNFIYVSWHNPDSKNDFYNNRSTNVYLIDKYNGDIVGKQLVHNRGRTEDVLTGFIETEHPENIYYLGITDDTHLYVNRKGGFQDEEK